MAIMTTAFAATATLGVATMGWRLLHHVGDRQERIVLQIQQAFRASGLGIKGRGWDVVECKRVVSGKGEGLLHGWKLAMRYPEGKNLYDVQGQLAKISEWLDADIKASGLGAQLYLTVYDPTASLVVPYSRKLVDQARARWRVPVGLGEEGWVWHDFTLTPHILIGGSTNMGKTNYLTSLVYTLFRAHSPEDCRMYVVDMKRGLSFRFLLDTPYLAAITTGTAEDHVQRLSEAEQLISNLVAEMHGQYAKFETWGVTDWREAELKGHKVPHRFLVVDECAEMRAGGKEGKALTEAIWAAIASLTQLGRAAAVHVILSTQRPEVDVIPGLVKANLDARLAFRLPDLGSSTTILGRPGAEHLPPVQGRALYLTNTMTLVQTPMVDLDSVRLRAALTIQKWQQRKTETPEQLPAAEVDYADEWEGAS